MNSPAFQFYPNDFLGSGSVAAMTLEEVGAYWILLCYDWNEGGLPDDFNRLARWCRVSRTRFNALWKVVGENFSLRDGRYFNDRLDRERAKQADNREKRQRAAHARWDAERMQSECSACASQQDDAHASGVQCSPSSTPSSSSKQTTSVPPGEYPADFELLWHAYPKRSGSSSKSAAFRQFKARLAEGVTFEAMHDGVMRYATWATATGKVGTELVQMPATFLGRDRHFAEPWDTPAAPPTLAGEPHHAEAARIWALCKRSGIHHATKDTIDAELGKLLDAGEIDDAEAFRTLLRRLDLRFLRAATSERAAVTSIAERLAS